MSEIELHQPQSAMAETMEYARAVSSASMLPDAYRGKPADIMVAVGLGQAMGLSPAESLYRIAVIKGKPTASAELIASNVRKAGHRLRTVIAEDGRSARASIWRADDPEFEHTVIRDAAWAQSMGLATNDNYRKQMATMLANRAITAVARLACPEALYGVAYSADEMGDTDAARPAAPTAAADRMRAALGGPQNTPTEVVEAGEAAPLDVRSRLAKAMFAAIKDAGITDEYRLEFVSQTIGREVGTSKEMTEDDARLVLDTLADTGTVDAEVVE